MVRSRKLLRGSSLCSWQGWARPITLLISRWVGETCVEGAEETGDARVRMGDGVVVVAQELRRVLFGLGAMEQLSCPDYVRTVVWRISCEVQLSGLLRVSWLVLSERVCCLTVG